MAQYYAAKSQDKAMFQTLLDEVLAGDPTAIEGIETEQRQEQLKAQKLLDKIDELFLD